MIRTSTWLLVLVLASAAHASLAPAVLGEVSASPAPGAALPLSLTFKRLDGEPETLGQVLAGKPALVIFADFTCTNLCGPILTFAAKGLAETGLTPGKDFGLVIIGLDPKDTPEQARRMVNAQVGTDSAVAAATAVLRAGANIVAGATRAAGYHYVYDKVDDQFAHPAAAYVVSGKGQIVRVLSGLGLSGNDLRLALVDAGRGRVGSVIDQIRLRCFGFDPSRGIYTASVTRLLTAAGVITIIVLSAGIGILTWAHRRRPAS